MATQDKAKMIGQVKSFFQEVMAERDKIVWPTREVLVQSTSTVVLIVVALSVYLGAADVVCRLLFQFIER